MAPSEKGRGRCSNLHQEKSDEETSREYKKGWLMAMVTKSIKGDDDALTSRQDKVSGEDVVSASNVANVTCVFLLANSRSF